MSSTENDGAPETTEEDSTPAPTPETPDEAAEAQGDAATEDEDTVPSPEDQVGYRAFLDREHLAACERACFMAQAKYDTAVEHQPGLVDQYAQELADAQRQFTDLGGVLPAKTQKRKSR